MPETRVVNLRVEPFDIYIGRAVPRRRLPYSKWANPFKLDGSHSREEAVEKYRAHVLDDSDLLAALPELIGKRLGCWCAPLLCHGSVLVELVERLYPASARTKSEGEP